MCLHLKKMDFLVTNSDFFPFSQEALIDFWRLPHLASSLDIFLCDCFFILNIDLKPFFFFCFIIIGVEGYFLQSPTLSKRS